MRRMYSVQELSEIVSAVVGQKIEDGSFDEVVAGAVDDYLTEHPVDITALEGLDISVGSLDATGLVTGGEIIEKMSGYSAVGVQFSAETLVYVGVVKNGNKITFVIFAKFNESTITGSNKTLVRFTIPSAIGAKLYPYTIGASENILDDKVVPAFSAIATKADVYCSIYKASNVTLDFNVNIQNLTAETNYIFRWETTFLLDDNLVA